MCEAGQVWDKEMRCRMDCGLRQPLAKASEFTVLKTAHLSANHSALELDARLRVLFHCLPE